MLVFPNYATFLTFAFQEPWQISSEIHFYNQKPFILDSWFGNWLIRSCNGTFLLSHNPPLLYFPFVDCREPFLAIVAGSGLSFLWESCKVLLESAGIAGAIFYPCLWEVFGPTWFVHTSHVCSQSLFGCSQRMNGMSRMQFDDVLFNLLSLVIWSRVSWLYLKCNLNNNFNRCYSHLE